MTELVRKRWCRLGCRFSWDVWSPASAPLCHNLQQAVLYERRHIQLYENTAEQVTAPNQTERYTQPQLTNSTGCRLPCQYTEYRVLETSSRSNQQYGLIIRWVFQILQQNCLLCRFARATLFRQTEALVYDSLSLVGEAGGALGLCLGFSLLNIWDLLGSLIFFIRKGISSAVK